MSATGSQWNASSVSVARRGRSTLSHWNPSWSSSPLVQSISMGPTVRANEDRNSPPSGIIVRPWTTTSIRVRPGACSPCCRCCRPDRSWSGPELAERLGVTVRTVRRDVERLRRLGYPVLADVGTPGGYRLGAGGRAMPPLMLDRDEALAVAVCLRSTATESIAGGGEAAIRALAKLEQLLPSTLRRQVGAISTMTTRLGSGSTPVDPEVLVTLTRACRDGERLRVRYRDRARSGDRAPPRSAPPGHARRRRWYLVARDVDRGRLAHAAAWTGC